MYIQRYVLLIASIFTSSLIGMDGIQKIDDLIRDNYSVTEVEHLVIKMALVTNMLQNVKPSPSAPITPTSCSHELYPLMQLMQRKKKTELPSHEN